MVMGRQSRRFSVRLGAVIVTTAAMAWACRQWQHRPSSTTLSVGSAGPIPPKTRKEYLDDLTRAPFDVLVVGGGLTGLYAAVDSAQRGMRVALVEAQDYGSGGSSNALGFLPGAFPYAQRAIRQRDGCWLLQAAWALESWAVWRNTAPHCLPPTTPISDGEVTVSSPAHVGTLLPALHKAEMIEYIAAALLSSSLSVICGGPLRWCDLVGPSAARSVLPAVQPKLSGAVLASDGLLHTFRAVLSLAATAEAFGVALLNYAPLFAIEYEEEPESTPGTSLSASPLVVAHICDATTGATFKIRTRGVLACAGSWADEVKAMTPGNVLDAVPQAYEGYDVHTYVVAPRAAIMTRQPPPLISEPQLPATLLPSCTTGPPLWDRILRLSRKQMAALQIASQEYSFEPVQVLPWHDRTILVGPTVGPLRSLPSRSQTVSAVWSLKRGGGQAPASSGAATKRHSFPESTSTAASETTADHPPAQTLRRLSEALHSCGLLLDDTQLLSSLRVVVPVLKKPSQVPWSADMALKGYYVATMQSSCHDPEREREDCPSSSTLPQSTVKGSCVTSSPGLKAPPFVHVYGGTPLHARRIAAEAVDMYTHGTTALTLDHLQRLRHCQTQFLQLHKPSVDSGMLEMKASGSGRKIEEDDAAQRVLNAYVERQHVQHVMDVIFRRTLVGYTSPWEAVRAVPAIAEGLAPRLGWSSAQKRAEVAAAIDAVQTLAIVPPC